MSPQNPFEKDHPLSILRSIVDTAIDGIFLMDSQGKILMCNPAGHSLFGYVPGELPGKDITILMPPPHRESHSRYVHNYLETGIKKIIGIGREIEGLRKNGTLFPARLAVSEIVMDEQHYFTGIIHDLTEFKNIQQELIQLNQELEKIVSDRTNELQDAVNRLLDTNLLLNQSIDKHKTDEIALMSTRDELKKSLEKEMELGLLKSNFISMASHEFKTPLSTILSSVALIARYETTEQAEDRLRHIERIKGSVTHLNLILTDFLSISKLEEGRVDLKITIFTIDSLITNLLGEMEVILKKGQTLSFDYETDQLGITSDKSIIRNILFNLLSNAVKYSDEDRPIHGLVKKQNGYFIIEIRDKGIGIPDKDRKYIGTRFFRASNASNIQGTGLGLNIVNSYLAFLKGSLTFKNNDEGGTTFTLIIPSVHEE